MEETFEQVWEVICARLRAQPPCNVHPEFPCIYTLTNRTPNDVLSVEKDRIQLRSHHGGSKGPRYIEADCFRKWWSHLLDYGTATLLPYEPNNPDPMNTKIVGAIWVLCLPERIALTKPDEIRLVRQTGFHFPEEITRPKGLLEGALVRVTVNAYERSPEARRICIEHYGPTCVICEFSFGSRYGEIADGYIHVHHLRSLAETGEEYEVNPIKDLRPVCPNCHAILHLRFPPYSIEDVQSFLT